MYLNMSINYLSNIECNFGMNFDYCGGQKISQTYFFPDTINLQRWDTNQPLIPLFRWIELTGIERINVKYNYVT